MNEDKTAIIKKLMEVLQMTRAGADIVRMDYVSSDYDEVVEVEYFGGGRKDINVSIDSGAAMIRDVMKEI